MGSRQSTQHPTTPAPAPPPSKEEIDAAVAAAREAQVQADADAIAAAFDKMWEKNGRKGPHPAMRFDAPEGAM